MGSSRPPITPRSKQGAKREETRKGKEKRETHESKQGPKGKGHEILAVKTRKKNQILTSGPKGYHIKKREKTQT